MKQQFLTSWACRAALITVLAVSVTNAADQVVLIGSVSFDSGRPVVDGTIEITDMRSRFLRRMPKPVVLATVKTDADGQFRAELTDIRGYLDIRLVYARCRWTGAAESIDEEAIGESDSIRVDLTTRESVSCSDSQ